jgi:hypothetical protein
MILMLLVHLERVLFPPISSLVPMSDEEGNPTTPPISLSTSWSPENEVVAETDDFDNEVPIVNFTEMMEEIAQQLEGLASEG